MIIPKNSFKTVDQFIKILQEREEVSLMITSLEALKTEDSEAFIADIDKVKLLEKLKAL